MRNNIEVETESYEHPNTELRSADCLQDRCEWQRSGTRAEEQAMDHTRDTGHTTRVWLSYIEEIHRRES